MARSKWQASNITLQVDYSTCGKECQLEYMSVSAIAEKFGFKAEIVRNMCHARGQRFAYRLVPNGKFWIDPIRFKDYIERKRA